MNELLTTLVVLTTLLVGVAALLRYVRRDAFAGPGTGHRLADELGELTGRRRPA